MLSLWFRPPVGSAGGVRLPGRPLHMMQLTQQAQIPQFMRALRVNMVDLVTRRSTEHAPAAVTADDSLTDPPPVGREFLSAS